MKPDDDRLVAELVAPLVTRTEALAGEVEALAADVVHLEGELRRRLSACRCRPGGRAGGRPRLLLRLGVSIRKKGGEG